MPRGRTHSPYRHNSPALERRPVARAGPLAGRWPPLAWAVCPAPGRAPAGLPAVAGRPGLRAPGARPRRERRFWPAATSLISIAVAVVFVLAGLPVMPVTRPAAPLVLVVIPVLVVAIVVVMVVLAAVPVRPVVVVRAVGARA